jgi:hypothetical protein
MDFRIIGDGNNKKKFELELDRKYEIPVKATHIHVRAGKLCFGICSHNRNKITNRGKFFKIPKMLPGGTKVSMVSFPAYYYAKSGHNYGEPEFHP